MKKRPTVWRNQVPVKENEITVAFDSQKNIVSTSTAVWEFLASQELDSSSWNEQLTTLYSEYDLLAVQHLKINKGQFGRAIRFRCSCRELSTEVRETPVETFSLERDALSVFTIAGIKKVDDLLAVYGVYGTFEILKRIGPKYNQAIISALAELGVPVAPEC